LSSVEVRHLTALQLDPLHATRLGRYRFFALEAVHDRAAVAAVRAVLAAGGPPPPGVDLARLADAADALRAVRRSVWRGLVWDNGRKEPWWRLAVDGFPNAVRMGRPGERCPCGLAPVDRLHDFWECPAAGAVVAALRAELGPGTAMNRAHVWLMEPPGGVNARVWQVVCLAAVAAMRKATALLHGWRARGAQGGPPSGGVAGAGARAVTLFWTLLHEFAALPPGAGFRGTRGLDVSAGHPFLRPGAGEHGWVVWRAPHEPP